MLVRTSSRGEAGQCWTTGMVDIRRENCGFQSYFFCKTIHRESNKGSKHLCAMLAGNLVPASLVRVRVGVWCGEGDWRNNRFVSLPTMEMSRPSSYIAILEFHFTGQQNGASITTMYKCVVFLVDCRIGVLFLNTPTITPHPEPRQD